MSKKISTQKIICIILLFVGTILLVFSLFNECCDKLNNILIGIGTGFITSSVVTISIEYINSYYYNRKEQERYNIIVSNLRSNIFRFNKSVLNCCSEKCDCSDETYDFNDWISLAFERFNDETEEDYVNFLEDIIYYIQKIADSCDILQSNALMLMNDHITKKWVRNVASLGAVCNMIVRKFEKCEYESCKNMIINQVKKKIGYLFKDIGEFLGSNYNEYSEDIDGWSI